MTNINTLYHDLLDIIENKENKYMTVLTIETLSFRTLLAAYEGICNTINLIIKNERIKAKISHYINCKNSKIIVLTKCNYLKNESIFLNIILNNDKNEFTIKAIYNTISI